MISYDVVILFSGGADSVMLFDMAMNLNKHPLFLMIDYGQLHKEELTYAKEFLKQYNVIQHSQTVKIDNMLINSGLTGNGETCLYNGVNEYYVPARNMIFISIAASIAEANNIDTIWYGADYSDRLDNFPDCYQEWVVKINEMLKYNGPRDITVEAPLMGMSKRNILTYLHKHNYGVNIFSGYGDL